MRLARTGASSSASAAVKGGSTENAAGVIPDSRPNLLSLPPVSSNVPPARILGAAWRAISSTCVTRRPTPWPTSSEVLSSIGPCDRRVYAAMSTWSIGAGSSSKKRLTARCVVGVEGGAATSRQFARRFLEPLRIAGREDDVGALAAGQAGGLQPDARAAADHDDGLAEQPRLTRD